MSIVDENFNQINTNSQFKIDVWDQTATNSIISFIKKGNGKFSIAISSDNANAGSPVTNEEWEEIKQKAKYIIISSSSIEQKTSDTEVNSISDSSQNDSNDSYDSDDNNSTDVAADGSVAQDLATFISDVRDYVSGTTNKSVAEIKMERDDLKHKREQMSDEQKEEFDDARMRLATHHMGLE